MIKKRLSPLMVMFAGILWGSMGIFVRKYNANNMGTIDIVAIRAVLTMAFMGIGILIYDRKLLKVKLRDLWCFVGTGILSIVFFNYCYFKAITLTSMAVAAVLLYTAPAIVMLLSRLLFGEKLTKIKGISLIVTFVGCVFVTGVLSDTKGLSLYGILVGLGAGLGYGLYSIFSKYAINKGYNSLTITFYTFLFATIGVIPMCNRSKVICVSFGSVNMIIFSVIFAIVSTVLPYILYTLGLKNMENGRASIIASVEPVMAAVFGAFIFGERLTIQVIVGIVLVLSAIVMCNIKKEI